MIIIFFFKKFDLNMHLLYNKHFKLEKKNNKEFISQLIQNCQ